jgi:hypothetical protein
MRLGTEPTEINGTLRWLPIVKHSALATIGAALVVIVAPLGVIAVLWWYARRRRGRGAPRYSVEQGQLGLDLLTDATDQAGTVGRSR